MHELAWIWSQSDKAGSAANKNPGSSKICCDVDGDDGREMDIEQKKVPEAAVPGKENLSPKSIWRYRVASESDLRDPYPVD